jgi:hypothetical protein
VGIAKPRTRASFTPNVAPGRSSRRYVADTLLPTMYRCSLSKKFSYVVEMKIWSLRSIVMHGFDCIAATRQILAMTLG